jgi:hypothetical protein
MYGPGIGVGASRATAAPLISNIRTRRTTQQPTTNCNYNRRHRSSSGSSPSPRPSPTAHRSTGGHRGQHTPQPAPVCCCHYHNSSTKRPCYGASASATTFYFTHTAAGGLPASTSAPPAIQQMQINTAVGVGEGPDFGSDCCAQRSWQQNKRKHRCVDPKLNGAHPSSLAGGRVRGG